VQAAMLNKNYVGGTIEYQEVTVVFCWLGVWNCVGNELGCDAVLLVHMLLDLKGLEPGCAR
jgi:hypothetical protein